MAILAGSFLGVALGFAFVNQMYGFFTFAAFSTIVVIIAIIKDNKK